MSDAPITTPSNEPTEPPSTPPTTPPTRSLRKRLFGCGCAVLIGLALCTGVGGYVLSNAVTKDHAEIVAIAERILPGAELPAGYRGAIGIDLLWMRRAAMLTPETLTDGQPLTKTACLLLWVPTSDPKVAAEQIQHNVAAPGQDPAGTHVVLEPEQVTVAGKPTELHKMRLTGNGVPQLHMHVFLPLNDNIVVILFAGPEAGFDRDALDAFLASVPNQPK